MTLLRPILTALSLFIFSPIAQTTNFERDELIQLNHLMISRMIQTLGPNLSTTRSNDLAKKVYVTSRNYSIDPKLILAIIATESNFRNDVVSSSGDFSLGQINVKIWNKEFKRLGIGSIDKKELQASEEYALKKMGEILTILRNRHKKEDPKWYSTYHSRTKALKNIYSKKIEKHLGNIASLSR